MKAYAALVAFVAVVVIAVGWFVLRTDWASPDYAAHPDTSLNVAGHEVPCETLMSHPCDRNDQRLLEQAQERVDEFLAVPNLASLTAHGELDEVGATSLGLQACSNRFWSGSSAVFADAHSDLTYPTAFTVWSAATRTLCTAALS